jgi:hypothetical protein
MLGTIEYTKNYSIHQGLDWPDRTGLILVRSGPKVKDRTVKQSPFLVWTRLKLL